MVRHSAGHGKRSFRVRESRYPAAMDQLLRWTIRMSQWLRRAPSRQRLILLGAVIGLCLAVFAVERLYGWPSWLTVNGRMPRVPRHL